MGLVGKDDEEKIWNYLKSQINNNFGVAGLMGNLYAESGLRSNNLQNTYEKSLGLTDVAYTNAVDNGSYTNFIQDKAGYGLAQWTFWSRKEKLYNYIKERKKSIGDLESQLTFLLQELSTTYPTVLNTLKNAKSVQEASNAVLLQFERPRDQSVEMQQKRAKYGQVYYDKYAKTTSTSTNNNTVSLKIINKFGTHNTTVKNNRPIEWIVIHYTAGTTSVKGAAQNTANWFLNPSSKGAADFIVDDAEIVQYNPDPKNRYCWAVGGAKYSNTINSLATKYYNQCKNSNSISIEICSSKKNKASLSAADNDWYFTDAVVNNAVKLTKYLMNLYKIDINHIITHNMVTGKWCPQPWVKNEQALQGWYNFLNKVKGGNPVQPISEPASAEVPFLVRITANSLNVRKGPSTSYEVVRTVSKPSVYTIVEVQGNWGRLKSGVGWISLKYTERI